MAETMAAFHVRRAVLLAAALAVVSCAERIRDNPLDPQNPETLGKPGGLRAMSEKHDVTLSWEALDLSDMTGYRLYRRDPDGNGYVLRAEVGKDSSKFVDTPVPYEQTYSYRVSVVAPGFESPLSDSISITPGPFNHWAVDYGQGLLIRLTYDVRHVLAQYASFLYPTAVESDTVNRTVWVLDSFGYLVNCSRNGDVRFWVEGLTLPWHMAWDKTAATVWISDLRGTVVSAYDTTGIHRFTVTGFQKIADLAADAIRGGCWVSDSSLKTIVRIDPNGTTGVRVDQGLLRPGSVSFDPVSDRLWAADSLSLIRMTEDGIVETVWDAGFPVRNVSADPTTGRCWAVLESGTAGESEVVCVGDDGLIRTRVMGFRYVTALTANTFSGGCLVADRDGSCLVRLSATGQVLGILDNFWSIRDLEQE